MTIIEPDPVHGTPWGSYDVFYYELRGGQVRRDAGFDRDVDGRRIDSIVLKATEAAEAICRSQPGVTRLYGSARMKDAMERFYRRHEEG